MKLSSNVSGRAKVAMASNVKWNETISADNKKDKKWTNNQEEKQTFNRLPGGTQWQQQQKHLNVPSVV
jgi:hypothetical protein